jgi:hypothetical protein
MSFMECDTCRAKSGSPALCSGCLANRKTITELEAVLTDINDRIENSDRWWMDDPTRGGFDQDAIERVLKHDC